MRILSVLVTLFCVIVGCCSSVDAKAGQGTTVFAWKGALATMPPTIRRTGGEPT